MNTKRRRAFVLVGSMAVLLVIVAIVVHSPWVQGAIWQKAQNLIQEELGWRVEADQVRFRAWPARVEITELSVESEARKVASVREISARWGWFELLVGTPEIRHLAIDGLVVDIDGILDSLPEDTQESPMETDPWVVAEIDRFELRDSSLGAGWNDLGFAANGLALAGQWVDGGIAGNLNLATFSVRKAGRTLEVGPANVVFRGTAEAFHVDRFEIVGDWFSCKVLPFSAEIEPLDLDVTFDAKVKPGSLLTWWDPQLTQNLEFEGEIVLSGASEWRDGQLSHLEIEHRGEPLWFMGFPIERLNARTSAEAFEAEVGGSSWGAISGAMTDDGKVNWDAELVEIDLARLAAFLPEETLSRVGQPVSIRGTAQGSAAWPFSPESVTADFDLEGSAGGLVFKTRGFASTASITLEAFEVSSSTAWVSATGTVNELSTVDLEVAWAVGDPMGLKQILSQYSGVVQNVPEVGGALEGTASARGSLDSPVLSAEVVWNDPQWESYRAEMATLSYSGGLDSGTWSLAAEIAGETQLTASGVVDVSNLAVSGQWEASSQDLSVFSSVLGLEEESVVGGRAFADGTFKWTDHEQIVEARGQLDEIAFADWRVRSASFDLSASPQRLWVSQADVVAYGGEISLRGELPLQDVDSLVALNVDLEAVEITSLPVALPEEVAGEISAEASISGSLGQPEAEGSVIWSPTQSEGVVETVTVDMSLDGGVLRFVSRDLQTSAGGISVAGIIPLGDLSRPAWLLPNAPAGVAEVELRGVGLQTAPLLASLGRAPAPASARGDVVAQLGFNLSAMEPAYGFVEISDLVLDTEVETLEADTELKLEFDGNEIELKPIGLRGKETVVEAQGRFNLSTQRLQGVAGLELAPSLARLLPMPVYASGPFAAQVAVWGSLDSLSGRLSVDHSGGSVRVREPAIEISDLFLDVVVERGVVSIQQGNARFNQGKLHLGGGWDPVSGQGFVLEIDDASLVLQHGILTRWDGLLAIEPGVGDRLKLSGDLQLKAGLWERPVSLAEVLVASQTTVVVEDDPLNKVDLDLQIWGSGGISVDNNLGAFNVGWSVLRVGGTAAKPSIVGDIRINPGGRLVLAGAPVQVRRGVLRFAGDPVNDPYIEIVPVEALSVDSGDQSAAALARQGIAKGLSGMLGFENDLLNPTEIVVDTEQDSSSHFSFGRRINEFSALILSTDLADTSKRTSMLQLWNIPGLRGLALQVFTRTEDDEKGVRLLQKFQWGLVRGARDRPRLKKLKFEGEWPVSKRRLKGEVGLGPGEPYDPFLRFVGAVRLERMLAGLGYQKARIDGVVEGDEAAPILKYRCDLGPRQQVEFTGDRPSRRIRSEVTAMYQSPPLEGVALQEMREVVARHFRSRGFPDAEVKTRHENGEVVIESEKGEKRSFDPTIVVGLPEKEAGDLAEVLGSAPGLAEMARQPERLNQLVDSILTSWGFHDSRVVSCETEEMTSKRLRMVLTVDAGNQEFISSLGKVGDDPLEAIDFEDLGLRTGDRADRRVIEGAVRSVRDRYREAGYMDAAVDSKVERETDTSGWKVVLSLDSGPLRRVTTVQFEGLRHLREATLRHGIDLQAGSLFRSSDLDSSVVNLATFAPVERVDVKIEPDGIDGTRVEMVVTEKPRWTVDLGAGYGSERGVHGSFGIGDENLFGRGISLDLRGRVDRSENLYLLYGTVPARPGGRLALTSTLRYFEGDSSFDPEYLSKNERSISFGATIGLEPGDGSMTSTLLRPYYRFSRTHTFEKEPDPFFPLDITTDVATLGVQFVRDRYDNPFDPRRGYFVSADLGWSEEWLGSDLETARATASAGFAVEPWAGTTWWQVVKLGHATALGDGELDPEVRFFAGGQASIRGFDRDSVGPTTWGLGGKLVAAGGGALFVLNEELRVPVWGPVRVAAFADVGQVWESWSDVEARFAIGVGLGVRISTPIGPIWADVAWPVANRGITEDGPKYYFGIGRPF